MSAQPQDSEATTGLGLLMETAQAHQKLVEGELDRLRAHSQGLDEVVRAEIRRTLIEELGGLIEQAHAAGDALEVLQRRTAARALLWSLCLGSAVLGVAVLLMARLTPSGAQIASLRAERVELSLAIAELVRSGGRIALRRCGPQDRLCVHIDRQAGVYGAGADYLIVKGY